MLNRAARYFPILRLLKPHLRPENTILEIGSGSLGLGEFYSRPFVGCDLSFPVPPKRPMRAISASALQLPFRDEYFDIVLSSDVLEHISPAERQAVVIETLRVTREVAIFCFPFGRKAYEADCKLLQTYLGRGLSPPEWLTEHMEYPFPDAALFKDLPSAWQVKAWPNENVRFHEWLSRAEMSRGWRVLFKGLLLVPGLAEQILKRLDFEPSYRRILMVSRLSTA